MYASVTSMHSSKAQGLAAGLETHTTTDRAEHTATEHILIIRIWWGGRTPLAPHAFPLSLYATMETRAYLPKQDQEPKRHKTRTDSYGAQLRTATWPHEAERALPGPTATHHSVLTNTAEPWRGQKAREHKGPTAPPASPQGGGLGPAAPRVARGGADPGCP